MRPMAKALAWKSFFSVYAAFMLILSGAVAAQAQTAGKPATPAAATPAPIPTTDQLLDKYAEASGGRDAWQKLTSQQSIGTIDIPAMNISGTVEIHEKAPNKMLAVVVVAGAAFKQGYDGQIAWSDDPQNGIRQLSGGELEDTKRQADFYHALDLRKLYSKLALTGSEKIGEHDTYVVEASTGPGEPDKLYFDKQTGLPVRVIGQHHTAEGTTTIQEDLSDYRDVDGVKVAFLIEQTSPQASFTIKITEVHHNVDFENGQFSKPAAQ
jgi:hypothetical protein